MVGFEKHTEVEKYIEVSKWRKQERIFMMCSLFMKDEREKKGNVSAICTSVKKHLGR